MSPPTVPGACFQKPDLATLVPGEVTVLRGMYLDTYGDGLSMAYSRSGRRVPSRPRLRTLHYLGLVEFWSAEDGGWERGMWGARLTCLGANVVFRLTAATGGGSAPHGVHPRCGAPWGADGTCTGCRAARPLDIAAYEAYVDHLAATDPEACAKQTDGPALWCIEHGWMRTRDITTQKVCMLRGTDFHDGGLDRI